MGNGLPELRDGAPLTPAVFQILLALAGGERHGYGLMQEVLAQTRGTFRLGPGTLYGSIKRMLADGLIEESGARPDPALDDGSQDEAKPLRRRYYRLTPFGRQVAAREAERLAQLVAVAQGRDLLPPATEGGSL